MTPHMLLTLLALVTAVVHVSPAAGCSDAQTRAAAISSATPFCTVAAATALSQPGDRIVVAPGSYEGTVSVRSGTSIVAAAPGVTLDAHGASLALKVNAVHDVLVKGLTMRGGLDQAVWVGESRSIVLDHVEIAKSHGPGLHVHDSSLVQLTNSTVDRNAFAGIYETGADKSTLYRNDRIVQNGHDPEQWHGSGVEVSGWKTTITGCHILANGSSALYEHGVYIAAGASRWLVTQTTISGSSAADVKAGGWGSITRSHLETSRIGLWSQGSVTVSATAIAGHFAVSAVGRSGTLRVTGSLLSNSAKTGRSLSVRGGRTTLLRTTTHGRVEVTGGHLTRD